MKKRVILIVLVALSAAILLGTGLTTALLTDTETRTNVITIGRVSVTLSEDFTPTTVVPGSIVKKTPKLINSGNKDEFVFLKITVPKAEVTLLHEETVGTDIKGTPRAAKGAQEIIRFLADGTTTDTYTGAFDADITYHAGSDTAPGWIFLESVTTSAAEDVYYFGYNQKLAPTEETLTLFDRVQLKSFIDGEFSGNTKVDVTGYGIQADNMEPDGVDLTADYLGEAALRAVLAIVKNKAA